MTIYSLDVLLFQFEPVRGSMSGSDCCFLTCIQISQEASDIPISNNFPQFVVIHTVKGFGMFNKAEVDVFLELSCFFNDPTDGLLISGSSAFSKSSLNIWKFSVSPNRKSHCPHDKLLPCPFEGNESCGETSGGNQLTMFVSRQMYAVISASVLL